MALRLFNLGSHRCTKFKKYLLIARMIPWRPEIIETERGGWDSLGVGCVCYL